MRRMTLVAAGILLLAAPDGAQGQQAPFRLGYINSQAILQQTPGAQEAERQYQTEMQGFQAQLQQMGEELDRLIQQYEAQQLTLSPEARQQREQAILTRQQELQQTTQQLEQRAGERQQELVQPLMDRINDVIETLRSEGSYALIFDVAAGSIIAADPAFDLTLEVVRRLQAPAGDTIGAGGSP